MNPKKIFLFSRDPGAANTIFPLIDPLKKSGYEVKLYGKEFALKKYAKFGFIGEDINEHLFELSHKAVCSFLISEEPDLIITGTSAEDFTERYIWRSARALRITTIAILDQWLNYYVRFSEFSTLDLDKKNIIPCCLPNLIAVMDEYAKEQLVLGGIDSAKVLITGQPYFEFLINQSNRVSNKDIEKIKLSLGIADSDIVVTFVSEPILRDYGNIDYWGYTERTMFENFCDSLKTILSDVPNKIKVIIKIHPREDLSYYSELVNHSSMNGVSFVLDTDTDSTKIISISNLICGISSMFLIEAAILGKPILSLQIGAKRENPFILVKKGVLEGISSKDELVAKLKNILVNKDLHKNNFEFIKNPVKNLIHNVEKVLCQN